MPSKNSNLSQLLSNNANVSFNGAILVSGTPVINSSGYFIGPGASKGDKGTSGTSGTKGQKGDTGQKGSQLSSAAYYSSNDTVVFTNSDTTSFYTSGLKGDKGTAGAKGDTGSKGEVGDKGTTGDTGAKGDKGDTGSKGDKGEVGDKGSKGEQVYTVTYTDANNTLAFSSSDGSFFYANGVKGQKGEFLKGDKGDNPLGSTTGIVKAISGAVSAATVGVDYVAPNVATTFTASQTFSGNTSSLASVIYNIGEGVTVSATAATGTINYDITTQSVIYYTSNASANWTVNFRGSLTSSLNSIMSVGQSITVTFLVTQGSPAYYNNVVQVDGTTITPKWQGGISPATGNISSIDVYSYTFIKTGPAIFTVFASQTKFA
jgi:hypothetical protein